MLLVFGVRHFTMKTYNPAEIGLTDPSWNNVRFEAVQKYFHMMYIPFFPVGKFIGVRTNGNLYHLTPQVASQIDQQSLLRKTPWYSFIGPIIMMLVLIIASINSMVSDHNYTVMKNERIGEYRAYATKLIDSPSLFDYYQMAIDTNGGENNYVSHQTNTVYRVIGFNDKAIQFGTAHEDPFAYLSDPNWDAWLNFFDDSIHNSFWLDKAVLKNALIPSADEEYSFDGVKISMFGKPRYMRIDATHTIDGPEFEYYFGSSSRGEISFDLKNVGERAENISIKKISGNGTWIMSETSDMVDLSNKSVGSEPYSLTLTCNAENGKKHSFLISGIENDVQVKKIR
jgi:hypothetical protein